MKNFLKLGCLIFIVILNSQLINSAQVPAEEPVAPAAPPLPEEEGLSEQDVKAWPEGTQIDLGNGFMNAKELTIEAIKQITNKTRIKTPGGQIWNISWDQYKNWVTSGYSEKKAEPSGQPKVGTISAEDINRWPEGTQIDLGKGFVNKKGLTAEDINLITNKTIIKTPGGQTFNAGSPGYKEWVKIGYKEPKKMAEPEELLFTSMINKLKKNVSLLKEKTTNIYDKINAFNEIKDFVNKFKAEADFEQIVKKINFKLPDELNSLSKIQKIVSNNQKKINDLEKAKTEREAEDKKKRDADKLERDIAFQTNLWAKKIKKEIIGILRRGFKPKVGIGVFVKDPKDLTPANISYIDNKITELRDKLKTVPLLSNIYFKDLYTELGIINKTSFDNWLLEQNKKVKNYYTLHPELKRKKEPKEKVKEKEKAGKSVAEMLAELEEKLGKKRGEKGNLYEQFASLSILLNTLES